MSSFGRTNEALRLLQARGLVTVRPGPGGGLFACEPAPTVRLGNLMLALDSDQASVADAVRIRNTLDAMVVEDAVGHATAADIAALRGGLGDMAGAAKVGNGIAFPPRKLLAAHPDRRDHPEYRCWAPFTDCSTSSKPTHSRCCPPPSNPCRSSSSSVTGCTRGWSTRSPIKTPRRHCGCSRGTTRPMTDWAVDVVRVSIRRRTDSAREFMQTPRVTALEPRRRDCRDVIQRAIGRGELRNPGLATTLFELAIGQIMVRYVLQADGFDESSQADFVENTIIPTLESRDTNIDSEDANSADH